MIGKKYFKLHFTKKEDAYKLNRTKKYKKNQINRLELSLVHKIFWKHSIPLHVISIYISQSDLEKAYYFLKLIRWVFEQKILKNPEAKIIIMGDFSKMAI